MGLVDAFTAETRIPLKVSELYSILQGAADAEAENKIIRRMLDMGVFFQNDMRKLFPVTENSEEE